MDWAVKVSSDYVNLTSVESFQTRTGSYKTESNQSKAFKKCQSVGICQKWVKLIYVDALSK